MATTTHFWCLVGLAKCALTSSSDASQGGVLELKRDNFESSIKNGTETPWFVKFYAPWCGHCQRLAPEWERLAESLAGNVRFGNVDATVETELAEDWAVNGYPTLILIADSTIYDYSGRRDIESLEAFARGGFRTAKSSAMVQEEGDADSKVVKLRSSNFDSLVRNLQGRPCFVNFQIPSCGHCRNLAPELEKLATELLGEVNVASVDASADRALVEHWGVERFPTMKLVVGGSQVFEYDGERSLDDMKAFVQGGYSTSVATTVPAPFHLSNGLDAPPPGDRLGDGRPWKQMSVAFAAGLVFATLVSMLGPRLWQKHDTVQKSASGVKKME